MSEWKKYKLGEIATFSQGLQVPVEMQSSTCSDRQMRFIRIVDITQNLPANIRYINTPDEKYIIRQGDIVMLRYGYPGIVADNFEGVIANNLFKISPTRKDVYINKYLYYFLKQKVVLDYFDSTQNSTTMPAITFAQVSDLDILLPSIETQKVIAAILTSLDDKIDLLRRENATLEAMAETLFRQWFVVEAKEEWEERPLSKCIKLIGGGTPKTSEERFWNGNVCWLSGGDIANNHKSFVSSSEKSISEDGLNNSSAKLLPENAMVVSARGTVGKYCLLSKPMAFSQSNYGILPVFDNCYFFTYLLVAYHIDELQSAAYGSVFDTITTKTFEGVMVLLPKDTSYILEFEKMIAPYFKKMKNNNKQIHNLIQTRDGLLPRLMSGEIKI